MKKLIAALFAAILTTAGLVAVSSAPASAGCSASSYNCKPTKPKASGQKVVKQGKPAKVNVKVTTKGAGNVKPTGKVKVTIKGPGGFKRTVNASYDGKTLKFKLGKLGKPGVYKVTVKFTGDEGFEDSRSESKIAVKGKKKN